MKYGAELLKFRYKNSNIYRNNTGIIWSAVPIKFIKHCRILKRLPSKLLSYAYSSKLLYISNLFSCAWVNDYSSLFKFVWIILFTLIKPYRCYRVSGGQNNC